MQSCVVHFCYLRLMLLECKVGYYCLDLQLVYYARNPNLGNHKELPSVEVSEILSYGAVVDLHLA